MKKRIQLYNWSKYIIITFIFILFTACKQGKGAICRDGWRSHSTGSGTCSWHGGVDYYLDPDEISVGKTAALIITLIIVVIIVRFLRNKD